MVRSIILILIVTLFACTDLNAQQRFMARDRGRPLLKELQLTPRQRLQIQELIRLQQTQQLMYNLRLQQILTPAQKEKLDRYNKQKELLDSLDRQKHLP